MCDEDFKNLNARRIVVELKVPEGATHYSIQKDEFMNQNIWFWDFNRELRMLSVWNELDGMWVAQQSVLMPFQLIPITEATEDE